MKLTIIGARCVGIDNFEETQRELEIHGHESVTIPMADHGSDEDLQKCIEHDHLIKSYKYLASSEAVLVLNHPQNGVDG